MGFLYIKNKLRGNQSQFQWLKVLQSQVNLCTGSYKLLRKLLKTLINEKRLCVNILEEQTLLKCQYSNSCLQSWCHTYQNSNDIIHIDKIIIKVHVKSQYTSSFWRSFKQKEKLEPPHAFLLNFYYKPIVIQTAWERHKNRQRARRQSREHRNKSMHLCSIDFQQRFPEHTVRKGQSQ